MTCFPDEVNWNNKEFTKEMLDYLRAVYCVHPMVLDALDYINSLQARIAELEAAQKEALSLLPKLERGHYYCDDCWYSCPKAVDGCCDESRGDECDCGADDYNALLAKIVGLLTPEVQE